MNLTFPARPVIAALALTGAVGVGAAVASAAQGPALDQAATPATAQVDATTGTGHANGTTVVNHASPKRPLAPSSPVSLAQAGVIAARHAGGRVTEADSEMHGGALTYEVTVLRADGATTDVEVEGRTGRITSTDTEQPDTHDQSDARDGSDADGRPDVQKQSDPRDRSDADGRPDVKMQSGATN